MEFAKVASLAALLISSKLWALPFKCDKSQSLCEVQYKRLTVGDRVGVFTEDGQIAAVGTVVEIRGQARIVKIDRKWGSLLRSFSMEMIEDEKAKEPEKYYRVIAPLPTWSVEANLGVLNLGLGDGFSGPSFEGGIHWWWMKEIFVLAKIHYISASGEASDNLGSAVGALDSDLATYGLSGGLSRLFMAYEPVSLRMDAELGFSSSSVTVSGGFDEATVLNDRVVDGSGLYARLGFAAIWRREGFEPELGFSFFRLQDAVGYGINIGFTRGL